jgi:putative membrane protein
VELIHASGGQGLQGGIAKRFPPSASFFKGKGLPMNEQPQPKSITNELAKERSRQAADRTLMAWVRTSLSLIGFGFGIASFRDILLEASLVRNPQQYPNAILVFGLSFIALGVLGLLAATIQHWRILQHLKRDDFHYTGFRPLVFFMAILLMLIGLFAFFAVIF